MRKISFVIVLSSILLSQILNAEEKFLSLKKNKVNVRYGPSFDSEIKYIYKKINLPIKQIDRAGGGLKSKTVERHDARSQMTPETCKFWLTFWPGN